MAMWTRACLLALLLLAQPCLAPASDKTTPPLPRLLLPATGYWYDAERPGTGFALHRRDGVLGLVFYHFSDTPDGGEREADWHLAAGPLQGDTFEAALAHFSGGSCLGCDPFVAATAEQTDIMVRLVFASAREAMLQVGDGTPRRMVAMAYGVPYEAALATPADLPLPDLRGRWLLDGEGVQGVFVLEERIPTDTGVEYRGEAPGAGFANASMLCTAEGCDLQLDALPAPTPATLSAHFALGDISEERMTGADGLTFPLRAFRVEDLGGTP